MKKTGLCFGEVSDQCRRPVIFLQSPHKPGAPGPMGTVVASTQDLDEGLLGDPEDKRYACSHMCAQASGNTRVCTHIHTCARTHTHNSLYSLSCTGSYPILYHIDSQLFVTEVWS